MLDLKILAMTAMGPSPLILPTLLEQEFFPKCLIGDFSINKLSTILLVD